MADKVQSVRPVFQQRIVEAFERCVLQPFNTNRTAGGEFVKRAVQMGNFLWIYEGIRSFGDAPEPQKVRETLSWLET